MTENLLKEWKSSLLAQKWKYGLIHDKAFRELVHIYQNIEGFFPENDYSNFPNKSNQGNFLKSILASRHLGSLLYLREISRIIDYYNLHKDANDFNLKDSRGRVNFNEIRNRFFEIYFNSLLNENQIKSDLNSSYIDKNNRTRPLDSRFSFNGHKYLVECKKIYNEKGEIFWDLNYRIILYTRKYIKDIQASELFSGYIVIKSYSNLRQIKNIIILMYNELIKQHFTGFRDQTRSEVKILQKYEDDNIKINIQPTYTFNSSEITRDLEKQYKDFIVIECSAKNFISGIANLKVKNHINYPDPNELLFKKVKDKIRQHRDASLNKIYAFEIESLDIFDDTRHSFPVKKETIDWGKLNSLIRRDLSILIIIKTMNRNSLKCDSVILTASKFDNELLQKLKSMKYIII